MSNYTKGGWEVKRSQYGVNELEINSTQWGVRIATISLNSSLPNNEEHGNLRLILAAPEMYEILQELVNVLAVHSYSQTEAVKIYQLLARIDGTEEAQS